MQACLPEYVAGFSSRAGPGKFPRNANSCVFRCTYGLVALTRVLRTNSAPASVPGSGTGRPTSRR